MEREGFVSDEEDQEDPRSIISVKGKSKDRASEMRGNLIESQKKEDEFEKALTLGLFDYMRKSGSKGFVISLSGGADSSACAVLVASMIKRAKEELRDYEILKKTGIEAENFTIENLLTTAYQGTRNSSDTTLKAAEAVAKDIGCKHLHLDVDALVEAYKETVGDALGINWDWNEHDVTLQNIQARVRSPSIWMIANVEHKILLATSNRSEAGNRSLFYDWE